VYEAWSVATVCRGFKIVPPEQVVDFLLVFFSYVKWEWSEAKVFVVTFLFPDDCASYGDEDSCLGFADFYAGDVDGDYGCGVVLEWF